MDTKTTVKKKRTLRALQCILPCDTKGHNWNPRVVGTDVLKGAARRSLYHLTHCGKSSLSTTKLRLPCNPVFDVVEQTLWHERILIQVYQMWSLQWRTSKRKVVANALQRLHQNYKSFLTLQWTNSIYAINKSTPTFRDTVSTALQSH